MRGVTDDMVQRRHQCLEAKREVNPERRPTEADLAAQNAVFRRWYEDGFNFIDAMWRGNDEWVDLGGEG